MRLNYTKKSKLPPLAWVAKLQRSGQVIEVIHGSSVSISERFFFEGAWAGDFRSGDFDSNYAFGSGCKIGDATALFVPPTHTLECLCYCLDGDHFAISNSLAFLLNTISDGLNDRDLTYLECFNLVASGLDKGVRTLTTLAGRRVGMLYCEHLKIDAELRLTFTRPIFVEDFRDYKSYTDYVKTVLARVFQNAADESRERRYQPLATISSGYDSATIAAWAKSLGCREAVTFPASRGSDPSKGDDSGAEIARYLDLKCIPIDRAAYTRSEGFPETETWGVGTETLSLREVFNNSPRLLLVGFMGDSVWERELMVISRDLKWKIRAGQNIGELRLALAFVYLPAAFIGAQKIPEINKISRGEEMRPWTLFNAYDRPICRRTLEEAGVPRNLFGQKKKATGIIPLNEGLQNTMTPQSYQNFQEFLRIHQQSLLGARLAIPTLMHKLRYVNERVRARIFVKLVHAAGVRLYVPLVFPDIMPASKESYLFHWSMEHLQAKYRDAMVPEEKFREVAAFQN
jgi:hypothetical protein